MLPNFITELLLTAKNVYISKLIVKELIVIIIVIIIKDMTYFSPQTKIYTDETTVVA